MRSIHIPVLLCALAAPGIAAAQAPATVNSYTQAEEAKAREAARAAGYQPGVLTMAQGGNLFFNAMREGRKYALTVTPDGKVYASLPWD
jgi:ABC-type sugar transport system substrate-binding protein